MSRIFRIALEGDDEQQPICVKGPLGEEMTKALNVAYAKNDPVTGEPLPEGAALESEQQDVTVMQKLINAVNTTPDENVRDGVEIYAVSEDDVSPEDVVNVANDLHEAQDSDEYVVIADASGPQNEDGSGETPETVVDISDEEVPALEAEIKEGAFHEWLGKKKDAPITKKDINKGLRSKDPHAKKMAQFAKNMQKAATEDDASGAAAEEPSGTTVDDQEEQADPKLNEWDEKFLALSEQAEKAGLSVDYDIELTNEAGDTESEAGGGEGGSEAGEPSAATPDTTRTPEGGEGSGEGGESGARREGEPEGGEPAAATEAHKDGKGGKMPATLLKSFEKKGKGKKKISRKSEKSKKRAKASLEALRTVTLAMGGKFFYSLEEYVESLETPVNPEIAQGEPVNPEQPGVCDPENPGADGTGEAGNTDHVTTQIQENGAAQPGAGQTDD